MSHSLPLRGISRQLIYLLGAICLAACNTFEIGLQTPQPPTPPPATATPGISRTALPEAFMASAEDIQIANAARVAPVMQWDQAGLSSLAWQPDSRGFAAAGSTTVVLYQLGASSPLATYTTTAWINALALSPDGHWLAAVDDQGALSVWDLTAQTSAPRYRLAGSQAAGLSLAFSPDSLWLAMGDAAGFIYLWQPGTGSVYRPLEKQFSTENFDDHSAAVNALTFQADGKILLAGYNDGALRFWDPAAGQLIRMVGSGHMGGAVLSLAANPAGTFFATGGAMPGVTTMAWDTNGSGLGGFNQPNSDTGYSLAFNRTGHLLAIGSDKLVILAESNSGEALNMLGGHTAPVKSVAFSPDGRWLISGSADQHIILWGIVNHAP